MKSIRFASFLRGLVLPVLLLAVSAQAQFSVTLTKNAPLPRRASIILILADGLGYGELSCNGQTRFQTPNLDKLAADGIRFTNYRVGTTDSSPALAGLLTGRKAAEFPQSAGADVTLTADEVTVAQTLKRSGYHTGWIGAWNLGDENSPGAPWRQGFDEFAGYFDPAAADNHYADYLWRYIPASFSGTNQMRKTFAGKASVYANVGGKKSQYIPDLYTTAAMNFMKNNLPDQFNQYQPFFLVLRYPLPQTGNPSQTPTDAPYSEEAWPQPEKDRAAMISRMDGYIARVRQQLQSLGMTNNVALFFTSDSVPSKLGGMDPMFFQTGLATNDLRVPMMAVWPDRFPAGRVSDFAWTAADFMPTVMDIALIKPADKLAGKSVPPVLSGQK